MFIGIAYCHAHTLCCLCNLVLYKLPCALQRSEHGLTLNPGFVNRCLHPLFCHLQFGRCSGAGMQELFVQPRDLLQCHRVTTKTTLKNTAAPAVV
jgi:hypothetical protein